MKKHTYDHGQGYETKLNDTKMYGFRCANHKMNIAIREAIKMHQPILDQLKKLNKSNSHVRRSIELNSIFKNNKCRLRLENNTRWSLAYLLLESPHLNLLFIDSCSILTTQIEHNVSPHGKNLG